MSIKRLANCAAGGTTAIAAAAMFNVAPAHAEGDLYTNAVGSSGTHLGYLGEDSTERVKVDVPSSRVAQAAEWNQMFPAKQPSPTLNPHLIRKPDGLCIRVIAGDSRPSCRFRRDRT